MGAFRVHGVTEQAAIHKARKKLGGASPERDMQILEDTYQKMKPVQISESFDAPQFCQDFINTAQAAVKCRAMSIMVYAEKVDKRGELVRNKRTGKIIKTWQKYAN